MCLMVTEGAASAQEGGLVCDADEGRADTRVSGDGTQGSIELEVY